MDMNTQLENQRQFFKTHTTLSVAYRKQALIHLREIILKEEMNICKALKSDLNKSMYESYMCEIGLVLEELKCAIRNIDKWSKDKKVSTPLHQFYGTSFIHPEPYGHVLIMSPWNYPFQLAMVPLVSALTAGNVVTIKPSAYAPETSHMIKKICEECFDSEYVFVVEGGRAENQWLLDQRYDYIFFTGGVTVGKLVMEKAARYCTPVTLELGGKSPCIVDETASLKLAAKRIVFGKFLNSGQTCVAPDYVLVHKSCKDEFIAYLVHYIKKFYGKDALANQDFPKIINQKHYDRLMNLMQNEEIVWGGKGNGEKIQPTVLDHITWDKPVMQEEIFGPILPILTFDSLDEIVEEVTKREKPLACYIFTTNKENERRLLNEISFGGGCINDTIIHLSSSHLPFGGVGQSGMGNYHGKKGFDTFTHEKSIMKKANWIDLPIRYQPYTKTKEKLLKIFLR